MMKLYEMQNGVIYWFLYHSCHIFTSRWVSLFKTTERKYRFSYNLPGNMDVCLQQCLSASCPWLKYHHQLHVFCRKKKNIFDILLCSLAYLKIVTKEQGKLSDVDQTVAGLFAASNPPWSDPSLLSCCLCRRSSSWLCCLTFCSTCSNKLNRPPRA